MNLQIDTAQGGVNEECGKALVAHGQEDASGARRALASALAKRDLDVACRLLGVVDEAVAIKLRDDLVAQFGEPT